MKFKISGDKRKIKEFLEEFIHMAKDEYDEQVKKSKVPGIPLDMGYYEDGNNIIFYNTLAFPKVFGLVKRMVVKKMEKNLKGFFEEKGLKVKVKFIGD